MLVADSLRRPGLAIKRRRCEIMTLGVVVFVPEDERCFYASVAASADAVSEPALRAKIAFVRVTGAVGDARGVER